MSPGPQLRDIHLPAEPSLWPWPPGIWLLLAIGLLLLIVSGLALMRALQRRRGRRRWQHALAAITVDSAAAPLEQVAAASELLRRALRVYDPAAAALQGSPWRDYLQALAPASANAADIDLLLTAPFQPQLEPAQAQRLLACVGVCLKRLLEQRG
jgi:hypothetical protein